MRRPTVPPFIAELYAERRALDGLIAGSVALMAAALDPKVWGPSLPTVQAAVRDHPNLESLSVLAAVAAAGLLLFGGVIGDSARARPIILVGLGVELLASLVGLLVPTGPLFVVTRFAGHASAAFIIPVSIALVATSYRGATRATAIGIAYGAYGAAGAAAPILLQILPGHRGPAFLATIAACALAIWVARSRVSDLTRPSTAERPYVIATAVWAFGIITATVGVAWIGGGLDNPLRWCLIIVGLVVVACALTYDRRRHRSPDAVVIDRRRVAVAVFVGVVLAISQTAAMLELPQYFRYVLGYGPVVAVVAVAPLFAALVLAGPVAGFLISRVSPRMLVGVGVVAVGLGNLALALVATSSATYLAFVVPCVLIGAGFVIATTVRTAIIFASVPRGLPATAAALNEASISIGTRIGIVLVTAIVAQVAMASYTSSVASLPAATASQAIETFRRILVAMGTPSFDQVASSVQLADVGPYVSAYNTGQQAALLVGGLTAVIGGVIALLALGRQDPLTTVYDHNDERSVAVTA